MYLTIVAVIFGIAVIVSRVIGSRYTTSAAPTEKLSAFAVDITNEHQPAERRPERNAPNLSIVIPCYNEEERLPLMLDATIKFCKETAAQCQQMADPDKSRESGHFADFEIIVVDDCSKDGTVRLFEKYKAANPGVRLSCEKVSPNRGKGFAVRTGFLAASGDYVLMADGDGATQISDVLKLIAALRKIPQDSSSSTSSSNNSKKQRPFIAVGSRAHLESEATAKRTFFRTVLMKAFHLVVQIAYFVGTRGSLCSIHDTQCGFKLFDRRLCEPIFLNNRLERFAFDVELFILANRFNLQAVEIPVNWVEVPGSKVNVRAMVQMGLDCLLLCFTYGLPSKFGWPVNKTGH